VSEVSSRSRSNRSRSISTDRVEVQINLRTFEQPMLVPVRLADSQYISDGCESWRVGLLVCGIRHHEQDIHCASEEQRGGCWS